MKSVLRLFLSLMAGLFSPIVLFFIPFPKPDGLLGYLFGVIAWPNFVVPAFLFGLPGALIIGLINFEVDRTRLWMSVLAAFLYEVGFMAVPLAVGFGLARALY